MKQLAINIGNITFIADYNKYKSVNKSNFNWDYIDHVINNGLEYISSKSYGTTTSISLIK